MTEHAPDSEYTIEVTLRNGRRSFTRSTMLTFQQHGQWDVEEAAMEVFEALKDLGRVAEREWAESE